MIMNNILNLSCTLNPVWIPRWTIRARVTNKSSIRNWSNSKGEGKLFSFEIVDESVSRGLLLCACMLTYCTSHMAVFFRFEMKYGLMEKYAGHQGEIRITAFNKEVDKFYSLVEQGKVSRSHSAISILTSSDKRLFLETSLRNDKVFTYCTSPIAQNAARECLLLRSECGSLLWSWRRCLKLVEN